ncbi:MAG: SDR family NAD(P)-dependent oxidoreductase [Edaphobacter sp.]|uniref:SDR family NAD(P)-dependent oxidoreductase n=1 Tax=Edaphobacter sp. TaxID=1934404 RepID=UPI00239A3542|nr:SDR family NAD(P)-dependent oxidoreductase [Edaphobacter sp.]MDE1177965.1 SDR family NAD(P)-dependent oxidoreductase [Edaphobacter sp.]
MYDYKKLFDLAGKKALVVGAGSGIGEAAALGLAAHGAHVICGDLNVEGAQKVVDAIKSTGGSAEALAFDLRDGEAVKTTLAGLDDLDVLVSTPAINVRKQLLDMSEEEFDRVMTLNLKGTFRLITAAGRNMKARGKGSIIAFASIRAHVVEPGQGVYAATKAGVLQMCRTLAAELGPHGVRVNAIGPGVVDTPLTAPIAANKEWYSAYANKSALGRWAKPHEMAGAVVYLASDAGSFVTGTLTIVDGGWTAIDGRFTPPL